jgi:hypothetical protein
VQTYGCLADVRFIDDCAFDHDFFAELRSEIYIAYQRGSIHAVHPRDARCYGKRDNNKRVALGPINCGDYQK